MSGGVRLGGNLDMPLEKRITGIFSDNTYREMLWLASDNSIQVGDVKSEIAIRTKGSLNILIKDKWHQGYHTGFKPTAADIGAVTKKDADNNYVRQGSSGVVYKNDDLAWNSPTGAYLKDNGGDASLIWHIGLNTGSTSAAQFHFNYANGGLKYRSSRDSLGFERPWARIYTDQDKPTAAEIGALPAAGTAVTATKLVTPRKINGVDFDGSKDITLTANILGSYTKTEADSRYVQSVQRGAAVNPPRTTEYGPDEAPAGCVVTRVLHHPGTAYGVEFTYRPLQIYINGTWRTITE
ncbi:tail fiber protein [Pectobacterium brasiliense]|uniref:tail fiber protein n=1 Tax=Pectobacterium brasiliense TaxID=180957 RepID=UPI0019699F92|nr:hypothetical protein [Pectobacterium brasiliense]MBN3265679.1 hypothetical protein [Pectobacterium brasiliense]